MIKNETLNQNLEIILNKNRQNITPEDLGRVEGICFSKVDKTGEQSYTFDELLSLPNLSRLTVTATFVTNEDIKTLGKLPNLKSLDFTRCVLADDIDYSELSTVEDLSISRSFINNYHSLSSATGLKSLVLFFPYNEDEADLDINDISSEKTLEHLTLEGCDIANATSFSRFSKLKTLNLLSTSVQHFDFINYLNSLETIYVEPRYRNDENLNRPNLNVQVSKIALAMDDVDGNKHLV